MSVEKCRASASSAWLSYLTAMRPSTRERHQSIPMEKIMTAKAARDGSISTRRKNKRTTASYMTQAQVSSSNPVSRNAEKLSTLPWPYWWSASAGLSETPTEKNVSSDAIKSRAECAASDRIPRLPV